MVALTTKGDDEGEGSRRFFQRVPEDAELSSALLCSKCMVGHIRSCNYYREHPLVSPR